MPLILFAPYVSREMGTALVSDGINFVDRGGNCHVNLGGSYVAHVEGRSFDRPRVPVLAYGAPDSGSCLLFLSTLGSSMRQSVNWPGSPSIGIRFQLVGGVPDGSFGCLWPIFRTNCDGENP